MLGSADKEQLRVLVGEIGREIRACLAAGDGEGYSCAADLVAELLELRVVEHGFVASLVAQEVRCAVEEFRVRTRARARTRTLTSNLTRARARARARALTQGAQAAERALLGDAAAPAAPCAG